MLATAITALLGYAGRVVVATLIQIVALLGPLLILALVMDLVSLGVERLGYAVFGQRWYLRLFGWLGVTVHELGHALFCVLFRHRIEEIRLFDPDPVRGSLGYVNHSYNSSSVYQQMGNFFIGIGPIISGSLLLLLGAYAILDLNLYRLTPAVGITPDTLKHIGAIIPVLESNLRSMVAVGRQLLGSGGIAGWRIAIFCYVLFAIGGSVALSRSDITGSVAGLLTLIALLLVFNVATLWLGDFVLQGILAASRIFSALYFLMTLSIVAYAVFAVVLSLILGSKALVRSLRR